MTSMKYTHIAAMYILLTLHLICVLLLIDLKFRMA
jgi:hypothetical protein